MSTMQSEVKHEMPKATFLWGTAGLPGGNPQPIYTECAWQVVLPVDLVQMVVGRARAEGEGMGAVIADIIERGLRDG
jgi:hypothetical protein